MAELNATVDSGATLSATLTMATSTGTNGLSAYEIAVKNGYVGTEVQWLASLKGKDGTNGKDGVDGKDGVQGIKGDTGPAGKDADVSQFYTKTEIDSKIGDVAAALAAIVGGA